MISHSGFPIKLAVFSPFVVVKVKPNRDHKRSFQVILLGCRRYIGYCGYNRDLSEFEYGAIVGARDIGDSISEVSMCRVLPVRRFHKCTVNIGNPIKHQISDIAAAE
jgi:hypothetical protein